MATKSLAQIRYEENARQVLENLNKEIQNQKIEYDRYNREVKRLEDEAKEKQANMSNYDRSYLQQSNGFPQNNGTQPGWQQTSNVPRGAMPSSSSPYNQLDSSRLSSSINPPLVRPTKNVYNPIPGQTGTANIQTPKSTLSPGHSKSTDVPKFRAPARTMGMTAKQHSDLVKQAKAEYDSLYNKDYINKAKEAKAEERRIAADERTQRGEARAERAEQRAIDKASKGTTKATKKPLTAKQAYEILDTQGSPEGLSPLELVKRKMALESLGLTEEQIKEEKKEYNIKPVESSPGDWWWGIEGNQEKAIKEAMKKYPELSEEEVTKMITRKAEPETNEQENEMVSIISPDGRRGTIPKINVNKALKKGYKLA
jgi:hypothetical protein